MSKPRISYNLDEAAESVGLSGDSLKAAVAAGELVGYRTQTLEQPDGSLKGTGRYLFFEEDLRAWVKSMRPA